MFCANTFQTMVQPQKMSPRDSCPISRNRLEAFGNRAMPKRQTKKTAIETGNCFVLQGMDSENADTKFLTTKKIIKKDYRAKYTSIVGSIGIVLS